MRVAGPAYVEEIAEAKCIDIDLAFRVAKRLEKEGAVG